MSEVGYNVDRVRLVMSSKPEPKHGLHAKALVATKIALRLFVEADVGGQT
jgi:hypothetical protein